MKSFLKLLFLSCIVFSFLPNSLIAQTEDILCAKNKVRVTKNNKVKIRRSISTAETECPRRTAQVFAKRSSTEVLDFVKAGDGSGSGIDADLLDGMSSSDLDQSSDVAGLDTRVGTLETNLTTAETDITTLEAETTSLDSRASDLETETRLDNVVRVSTAGGDTTSVETAIAGLSSPSLNNPYLILVGPGVYTISAQVTIPAGVHIRGSGIGQTVLQGTLSSNSALDSGLIRLSNGSAISELTIDNTATSGNFSAGITTSGITESNAENLPSFDTRIEQVRIIVDGTASTNYGIYLRHSDVLIQNVKVEVDNTNTHHGIAFFNGSGQAEHTAYIRNSVVYTDPDGGSNSHGIDITSSAVNGLNIFISGSHIYGDDAALYANSINPVNVYVRNSRLRANNTDGIAIEANNVGVNVNATHLVLDAFDNMDSGTATVNCAFISEADATAYTNTCE